MKHKVIEGYKNYTVNSDGVVVNTDTGRELKQEITHNGYKRVTVCKDNKPKRFLVHRLVAQYFIPSNGKPHVNHIDGDKLNNKASNLEWVTCSENHLHAQEIGLRPIGSKRASALLDEDAVHKVCKMIQDGKKRGEILASGIHPELKKHMVDNIRRRRTWKHVSAKYNW